MNVTNKDVSENYKELYESVKNPAVMNVINDELKAQRALEREILIKDHRSCPSTLDPLDVASNLAKLNAQKLKTDIVGKFYDASIMEAVSCIANSAFLEFRDGALAANEKLKLFMEGITRGREYIGSDAKVVGDESAYGIAMTTSLGDEKKAENAFVLKAPKSPSNADELIHESCVAFYGTNKMRELGIPNFAYVYGSFICNSPYIDPESKKEVISFCTKETGGVSYAIYENIFPSITMEKFCYSCSPRKFLYSYIQLMMAINIAYKEFDFTHYDLHSKNVLMREYNSPEFYVPFIMPDGNKWYCKSFNNIPTMIDYGMSHIVANGIHLGHAGASAPLFPHRTFRDRAFPLYDAYKLFMICLWTMRASNNFSAFNELVYLKNFFNQNETINEILNYQLNSLFSLAYTRETSELNDQEWEEYINKYLPGKDLGPSQNGFTLDNWIDYCRQYCIDQGWEDPLVLQPTPGIPILGCNGTCVDIDRDATTTRTTQEITEVTMNGILKATSFLEFFDVEGLMQRRIKKSLEIIQDMEWSYPAIANIRISLHQIRKEYNDHINSYGMNETDPRLIKLFNDYLRINTEFQNTNPYSLDEGNYMKRVREYELVNEEYEMMLRDFSRNFNSIFTREIAKINAIDITSFPIITLPDYALMLEASHFTAAKKFITQVVRFMDNLKRINLYTFAMYKLLNIYKGWANINLDELKRLYLWANGKLVNIKIFLDNLKQHLTTEITKMTNPPAADKPKLEMLKKVVNSSTILDSVGNKIHNPYKDRIWYFNTYPNIASFFIN